MHKSLKSIKKVEKKSLKFVLKDKNLENEGMSLSDKDKERFELFLQSIDKSKIIYRYIGDVILREEFNIDATDIKVLSEHIFLYGDKGRLFYKRKATDSNSNIGNVENGVFENIYCKLKKIFVNTDSFYCVSTKKEISELSCYSKMQAFFKDVTKEEWIKRINELDEKERAIVKNYYISFLHTVGRSATGDGSYFLSTSMDYEFCNGWRNDNLERGEKGIILVGWVGKQYYVNTWNKKKHDIIILSKRLPILDDALFKKQKEITLLCGMLPHFIIGFLYEDKFIVNPYIFKIKDMEKVPQEGLPVDQKDFLKNIKQTNLKSFYSMFGDSYFQY